MIDIKKIKIDIAKEIKDNELSDYEALARYVIAYHDYLDHMSKYIPSAKHCKEKLVEFIPGDYISF